MDNTIRPAMTTSGGAAAPSQPVVPRPQAEAPVVQDTVTISSTPRQQAAPQPQRVAEQPAAQPQVVLPPAHPTGVVEIPITLAVPAELLQPDEHGNVPLSMYTPELRPPNAISTTPEQLKELVDTVKKQTLPPGTHPELDDTPLSHKLDVANKTLGKVMTSIGGIATYSIAREGARFTLPASFASPLAMLAGGLAIAGGLQQAGEAAKAKGYYEGLKRDGNATVQVPVPTKNGPQMVEVGVDQMINAAKDQTIVGGVQAASGLLMGAAGWAMMAALPIAPALAIGSIALSVAGPLYAARGQFAMVAKAAWAKIKSAFSHKPAQPAPERKEPTIDPSAPAQVDPSARTEPTLTRPQEQPQS